MRELWNHESLAHFGQELAIWKKCGPCTNRLLSNYAIAFFCVSARYLFALCYCTPNSISCIQMGCWEFMVRGSNLFFFLPKDVIVSAEGSAGSSGPSTDGPWMTPFERHVIHRSLALLSVPETPGAPSALLGYFLQWFEPSFPALSHLSNKPWPLQPVVSPLPALVECFAVLRALSLIAWRQSGSTAACLFWLMGQKMVLLRVWLHICAEALRITMNEQ